jgi:hypothetical protein
VPPTTRRTFSPRSVGLKYGFRSGLEEKIAAQLKAADVPYRFEEDHIEYLKPARTARYTPDFVLPNGIVVETKGRFVTEDRQKHIQVKAQHPGIDLRIVFSNSRSRISKKSSTTYGMWCERQGIKYADRSIPAAWLAEPLNAGSAAALQRASGAS